MAYITNGRRTRFCELPTEWQALVQLASDIVFGEIHDIEIKNSLPFFNKNKPPIVDIHLEKNNRSGRQKINANEYVLKPQWMEIIRICEEKENFRIERIDIRSGIPERIRYYKTA